MICTHCGQPITEGPTATLPWVHTEQGQPTRQRCYPRHTSTPGSVAQPPEPPR